VKFAEWEQKIEELHKKTTSMLVDEEVLCEAVKIGEREFSVFLGDNLVYRLDGVKTGYYEFKRAYSVREKGWDRLLGGLTTKVTLAESLNIKLIKALIDPYMTEAVLDRLTSGADIADNETILRNAVERRVEKLKDKIPKFDTDCSFSLPSPSENYELAIIFNSNIRIGHRVSYGNMNGLKCCWSFLQNYEKIEQTVEEFSGLIKPLIRFCKKK
jgi:hypothetical protein